MEQNCSLPTSQGRDTAEHSHKPSLKWNTGINELPRSKPSLKHLLGILGTTARSSNAIQRYMANSRTSRLLLSNAIRQTTLPNSQENTSPSRPSLLSRQPEGGRTADLSSATSAKHGSPCRLPTLEGADASAPPVGPRRWWPRPQRARPLPRVDQPASMSSRGHVTVSSDRHVYGNLLSTSFRIISFVFRSVCYYCECSCTSGKTRTFSWHATNMHESNACTGRPSTKPKFWNCGNRKACLRPAFPGHWLAWQISKQSALQKLDHWKGHSCNCSSHLTIQNP